MDERVLEGLDVTGRQQLGRKAIRVRHNLCEMLIDDMIHRRVEVLIVIRRSHVDDLRSRRHAVHRFHVQGFFSVPALRILGRILGSSVHARRHDLNELRRVHRRQAAIDRPLIDVLQYRGRGVGIDDGNGLTRAVIPGNAVSTLDLRGRITLHCP